MLFERRDMNNLRFDPLRAALDANRPLFDLDAVDVSVPATTKEGHCIRVVKPGTPK
jgi:hypothetical protein